MKPILYRCCTKGCPAVQTCIQWKVPGEPGTYVKDQPGWVKVAGFTRACPEHAAMWLAYNKKKDAYEQSEGDAYRTAMETFETAWEEDRAETHPAPVGPPFQPSGIRTQAHALTGSDGTAWAAVVRLYDGTIETVRGICPEATGAGAQERLEATARQHLEQAFRGTTFHSVGPDDPLHENLLAALSR